VIDDDAATSTASSVGLEVGMVVDVKAAAASSFASPVAAELHVHPMLRGPIDAIDVTANTVSVLGQVVQLSRRPMSATTGPVQGPPPHRARPSAMRRASSPRPVPEARRLPEPMLSSMAICSVRWQVPAPATWSPRWFQCTPHPRRRRLA
jgi:hypothetical protein